MGDIEQEFGSCSEMENEIGSKEVGFVSHVRSVLKIVIILFVGVIAGVGGFIYFILSPVVFLFIFSFWKIQYDSSSSSLSMEDIYDQSRRKETYFQRLMMGSFMFFARLGLFLLLWLVVNVSVPRLKALTLLESPLWRWSLLAVALTCSYFLAISVCSLPGAYRILANIAKTGHLYMDLEYSNPYFNLWSVLFPSAALALYSGVVLVLWIFYFSTDAGLSHASTPHPKAFGYVTWTFVSLFAGSILMFLKALLLLKWSANAIYGRFQPKILITMVKFLYLNYFVGGYLEVDLLCIVGLVGRNCRRPDFKSSTFNLTNYIMTQKVRESRIQSAGRLLSSLAKIVTPLEEDGVPELLKSLGNHKFFQDAQMPQPAGEEDNQLLPGDDLVSRLRTFRPNSLETTDILLCLLREQAASEDNQLTSDDLKKWLTQWSARYETTQLKS